MRCEPQNDERDDPAVLVWVLARASRFSQRTTGHSPRTSPRGFTLIELSVVILIIGIILTFILAASRDATENAYRRSTQALIVKLEVGMNERLAALSSVSPVINGAHAFLASVNPQGYPVGALPIPWGLPSNQRAEVIARFDQFRMEIPDVFYIQTYNPGLNDYPVNFAGLPYPAPNAFGPPQPPITYALPLGHLITPYYAAPPANPAGSAPTSPPNTLGNLGPGGGMPPGTEKGIYGASYTARAALHKLIGANPRGTDAADNDGDGFVDEFDECTTDNSGNADPNAIAAFQRFFNNHLHATARAEMLYALLVEGAGQQGSVFGKEEFRDGTDYKDTDNDGLPEFVDGWGKPLQFYRWPVYYQTISVQGGSAPYASTFQTRESYPLDPNNQLVSPSWWFDLDGQAPDKSGLFQRYFTTLIDPNYGAANTSSPNYWDRTGSMPRRAFACKFLIVSSGPDQELGLYQIPQPQVESITRGTQPDEMAVRLIGIPAPVNAPSDCSPTLPGENWAVMWYADDEVPNATSQNAYAGYPMQRAINAMQQDITNGLRSEPPGPSRASLDNIDNHDLQNQAGGVR